MLGGCPYEWQRVPGLPRPATRCLARPSGVGRTLAARAPGRSAEPSRLHLCLDDERGASRPRGERIAPYDCRAIPGPDGTRTFKAYGARGAYGPTPLRVAAKSHLQT